MKVAYVYSDGDYGACTFESEIGIDMLPELWQKAKENGGEIYIDPITKHIYNSFQEAYSDEESPDDDEYNDQGNCPISIKSFEFGEVDPNFIKFIQGDVQDEDDSKHRNFYIIEG